MFLLNVCILILNLTFVKYVLCVTTAENMNHTSLCKIKVPKDIQYVFDTIYYNDAEGRDLDFYMAINTGCHFNFTDKVSSGYSSNTVFNKALVQVFALRNTDWASLKITWDIHTEAYHSFYRFAFDFINNSTATKVKTYQWIQYQSMTRNYNTFNTENNETITSQILFKDYYMPLYIKLDKENIYVGKLCDNNPLFVKNILIQQGVSVKIRFNINSRGTILYDCPYVESDFKSQVQEVSQKFPTTSCIAIVAVCCAVAVCITVVAITAKRYFCKKLNARQTDNNSISPLEEDRTNTSAVPDRSAPPLVYDEAYVHRINDGSYACVYESRIVQFGTAEVPDRYPPSPPEHNATCRLIKLLKETQ